MKKSVSVTAVLLAAELGVAAWYTLQTPHGAGGAPVVYAAPPAVDVEILAAPAPIILQGCFNRCP